MTPRITSLTVRDFRSIRGSVTIPLDSPVILIHGRNGAGKTSLLSALELGLTGKVSSFDRLDPNLREHLVHKEAETASVSLAVDGLNVGGTVANLVVSNGLVTGDGALSQALRTHYSERCYLGQATLSRLFEIYQAKSTTSAASPLTKFVKELLGLDALEALIDGLYDAGDVRRLRGNAVRYWEVRDLLPSVQAELSRLDKELAAAEAQTKGLSDETARLISLYWQDVLPQSWESWLQFIRNQSQEAELQRLASQRREVSDALAQLEATETSADGVQREAAESAAGASDEALQEWLETVGHRLTLVFQDLGTVFADLPSPVRNRPEYARVTARKLASTELERCQGLIKRHTTARDRIAVIEQDRDGFNTRLLNIDQQIGQHSREAGQLAQALSTIMPHIHSDDCPVCSRKYDEVSASPLLGHVAAKVASLTQSAGQLSALSGERSNTIRVVDEKTREIESLQVLMLDGAAQKELAMRMAKMMDAVAELDRLEAGAKRGEQIFASAAAAAQAVAKLQFGDQRTVLIRDAAARLAQQLGLEPSGANEPLKSILDGFMARIQANEKQLANIETDWRKTEVVLQDLILKQRSVEEVRRRMTDRRGVLDKLTAAMGEGDKVIENARSLLKLAQTERASIVRRVFNESLNATWRDLFVRLAPEEPFVPAFSLPESGRADVQAKLETLYRNGGKGGNPRAMLSAGNLNTAALTLFLALHLSARDHLPWLVIDDPVQSMDEVHISQFAALLRTLAKQQGRQVIIAVHEKPLFDYLCLELSPACPGDRLITVELGRTPDGKSVPLCDVKNWKEDLAIAA